MAKRILIVEDNMIIGIVTQRILTSAGYEVTELLSSGKDAVVFCRNSSPDLILMDIQLDGFQDGVDTMAEIRSFSEVPVIYLTGNSELKSREKAMQTGYHGFLIKPVQKAELLSAIARVFQE